MRSSAVTTRGPKDEPYSDFQKRVAADAARVAQKCAALDDHVPRCTFCGETCNQSESGKACKENGMRMVSRWAHELAKVEWYRLGHFGGAWPSEIERLAALLDRVRAAPTRTPPLHRTRKKGPTMESDACVCGHAVEEHGHDKRHPGSTACTECDCIAYEREASPPTPRGGER